MLEFNSTMLPAPSPYLPKVYWWWRGKGLTPLLTRVQWWMQEGWGQITGLDRCTELPSVLWHCCLWQHI